MSCIRMPRPSRPQPFVKGAQAAPACAQVPRVAVRWCRGSDSSGHSSPMAWDASVRAAAQAHFETSAEMETSSQGSAGNSSHQSRVRPSSVLRLFQLGLHFSSDCNPQVTEHAMQSTSAKHLMPHAPIQFTSAAPSCSFFCWIMATSAALHEELQLLSIR